MPEEAKNERSEVVEEVGAEHGSHPERGRFPSECVQRLCQNEFDRDRPVGSLAETPLDDLLINALPVTLTFRWGKGLDPKLLAVLSDQRPECLVREVSEADEGLPVGAR